VFGIRFKPAGIAAFTRVSVDAFTNRSVELSLVEILLDNSFHEILYGKKSTGKMIAYIDSYLLHWLPCIYNTEKQIICAVDLTYLAKGQLSLTKTVSGVCLCPQHFERKFKSAVSISPKAFAWVVRFKHALRCLENYPYKDLLSVVVAGGYYDHAHLIKDLITFSGDIPVGFRR
jgi:hypothetical protein